MKKIFFIVIICLAVAAIFTFSKAWAEKDVIVVGSIAEDPKEEIAEYQPFVDYLASNLEGEGIVRGKVVVAGSMVEMAEFLKEGKVDIFIDSPFPAIKVSELSGAKPFLRRWKKGVAEYHSVIFVRKDSGIETIEDLKGKMLALEEPFSSSSYFLPKATLMEKGMIMTEEDDPYDEVSPLRVGYVFTYDDETTMVWVLRKKVAGGAVNNIDYKKLAKDRINELKILARTINVPRQVASYRAGLSPTLVKAIEDVLINMDKDEAGKAVLKGFANTKKFDKFSGEAEESLKPVKRLKSFVEDELGK